MKTITQTRYVCEKCDQVYHTKNEAKKCEQKPITWDKGVKVGDIITITRGEGAGKQAIVKRTMVYDKFWGHYAWKRYWHTVGLVADLIGDTGSRQLTFDDYEDSSGKK